MGDERLIRTIFRWVVLKPLLILYFVLLLPVALPMAVWRNLKLGIDVF